MRKNDAQHGKVRSLELIFSSIFSCFCVIFWSSVLRSSLLRRSCWCTLVFEQDGELGATSGRVVREW